LAGTLLGEGETGDTIAESGDEVNLGGGLGLDVIGKPVAALLKVVNDLHLLYWRWLQLHKKGLYCGPGGERTRPGNNKCAKDKGNK
jgi:hypothetical protein